MENDFSAGCNTFWGSWEKMGNSALTSPTADAITNVLTTGVTRHIATTLEGIGDGASFGLTGLIRNAAGVDCYVQKDGFYYGGMVAGTVATTVATGGAGAGAVGNAGRLFRAGDELAQGAAETGAATAKASGDDAATFLYQKLSAEGEHLKFGITKNLATRYTSGQLNGGSLNVLASGARSDMLTLERSLHEWLPIGPEEGQSFYILKQIANGLRPPPYG